MALVASSLCGVTSQGAISSDHAIQTANIYDVTSTNFSAKLIRFPCRIYLNQTVVKDRTAQHLGRNRRKSTRGTILFAIREENDKVERGISHDRANDSMLKASDKNRSSKQSKEEVFVIPESRSAISQDAINQGNLLDKLKAVQLHVLAMEQWNASRLKGCDRKYLVSATNLIHYLALRSLDVQQLNEDLSSIGLLNLETINPYVFASLSAGSQMLENLKLNSLSNKQEERDLSIFKMKKQASFNKQSLLGPLQNKKTTHIMVTVGKEVLESETRIDDLLRAGTSIIRINCAHGDTNVWSEIIRRVKRSSQMLEKPCRVLMDLAGPKFRTDKLKTGPCVMKISPKKNVVGEVIVPAQVWLCPKQAGHPPSNLSPDAVIHVDGDEFLGKLESGDVVKFSDARGKQRILKISKKISVFAGVGFMAECFATSYVQSGTEFRIKGKKGKSAVGVAVDVPAAEQFIRLRVGDLLTISRDSSTEQHESPYSATEAPRITCSSGYLFDSVKPGEPIAFDDGKIWGIIQGTSISEIVVSITHAETKGSKLGSEKSINIPESNIRYEGLTSKDLMDLDFVAAHADMVGVSFVRDVHDIVVLRKELEKRKLRNLGIVLKIETKGGFEKLPLMLLEAMKSPNPLGVMIARGDLAVECGWERLADIQEEILYICSAAHVPVVWATQVLESLVKSGVPTRAEITDVHNGKRASCIMLNKGQYIVEGVSTLETILHGDSKKVKAELRPLVLSSHLF